MSVIQEPRRKVWVQLGEADPVQCWEDKVRYAMQNGYRVLEDEEIPNPGGTMGGPLSQMGGSAQTAFVPAKKRRGRPRGSTNKKGA